MGNTCPTCGQPLPQKNYPAKVFIITKALNVRISPNTTSNENVVGKLLYGEEIEPLAFENGWYKIKYQDKGAWINASFTQDISHKPVETVNLQIGVPNLAQNQNTIIIRKIIGDEFGGGRCNYDLQCTEYVQYRIKGLGCNIEWPVKQGRDGGKWADIFSKQGKYQVFNAPEKFCAISFTKLSGFGHIAFVEDVLEGGSIKISEANWPREGKYNERILNETMQEQYGAKYIKFL
jgi:surface antigen